MPRISKEKLERPFKRFDVLENEYVVKAKNVALRLKAGEQVPHEEIEEIRLMAVNDRKNLKGDFVISMFLDLVESGVKFERWTKGKSIHTNNKEIEKVFRNHFSKESSVTEFCRENVMTRNKYYRIVNCDVKNEEHVKVLEDIKNRIEKEYGESI